jgi:TetR/AcrR family transcriptional regulator, cholesterol catabolism regulator
MRTTIHKKSKKTTTGESAASERIISEARQHFMAHGFRGVTMDDLAAELGMSKKTLYAHFASKGALLEAVIENKLQSAEADLDRIAAGYPGDFLKALHELLECLRQHSEELQPPFLRDMAREAPELFQLVQTRRRAFIQRHFGKLLGEGRKTGMIRKDIATDLMIEILIGATDALIHPRKLSELKLPARTCLSAIITIFLQGVMTESGREEL